jgi:protein-tyrosine-phosphatase
MKSVLFVCTANRCRSVMAMGLFRDKVHEEGDWQVSSAGTWASEGDPAMPYVLKLFAARGIDLSDHSSRPITEEIVSQSRLILAMERGQKEGLRVEFPQHANRIYLLSEMIQKVFDIRDPVGGPAVDYDATFREIERILYQGFDRINQLVK